MGYLTEETKSLLVFSKRQLCGSHAIITLDKGFIEFNGFLCILNSTPNNRMSGEGVNGGKVNDE